jgi:1,4-dihydroxy-2-naphthoate octaprenyltransferase
VAKRNAARSGDPAKRAAAEKREHQHVPAHVTWKDWLEGARLRTLPLAIAPVVAGSGLAHMTRSFSWALSLLALGVALFLQIGVNFANDYSDGVRGTDEFRVGPQRLTASGLVEPRKILLTALGWFGAAAVCGLAAVIVSGRWWFLLFGVLAIVAAWFYTGGKKPYGYMGLGEVMVFIFFGIVATAGTYWLQSEVFIQEVWWVSAGVGLFAVAVLIANNVRDIPTDREAGKNTLSVRIGDSASRALYTVCVLAPFAVPAVYVLFNPGLLLSFFVGLLVVPAVIIMLTAKTAKELILVLKLTSIAALAYGVLVGIGFAF